MFARRNYLAKSKKFQNPHRFPASAGIQRRVQCDLTPWTLAFARERRVVAAIGGVLPAHSRRAIRRGGVCPAERGDALGGVVAQEAQALGGGGV